MPGNTQSVAVQHDLKYLVLPDQINLGNYEYDDFYKHAVVEVTGSEPGAKIQQIGQSVTYGVTMLQRLKPGSGRRFSAIFDGS